MFILINNLIDEGIDLIQFTDELIEFLRKLILTKRSGSVKEFAFDLDESMEKSIIDLAQKFEVGELVRLVNVFVAKKIEIKSATILQLPLEIAIIEYCNSKKDVGEENDEEDKGNDVSDSHGELDSAKKDEQVIKAEIMKKESTLLKSFKKQDEVKGSGPPSHKASSSANATEDKSEDKLNQEDVGGSDSATFKKSKEVKITISQIKDKWHDFLVELQKQNTSLVFILTVAEPLELKGIIL